MKLIEAKQAKEFASTFLADKILQAAVNAVVDNCPGFELVRCKDCKHWHDSWVAPDGKHEHGECYMEDADDVIVGRWGDDFCSYGERKDNAK